MQKWDHAIGGRFGDQWRAAAIMATDETALLAQMGASGWELVTVVVWKEGEKLLYFKRPSS